MRKLFLLLIITFLVASGTSFAQFNMYIKAIDSSGVLLAGTSSAPAHAKEIELYSESFGLSNACRTCPTWSSYNVMLKLSPPVIKMMQMSTEGKPLRSLDVSYRRVNDSYDFYKIHMEDVTIESVQESGSTGGDSEPTVSASFTFNRVAYMFAVPISAGGYTKTKGGWDVVKKVPWSYPL